MSTLKSNISHSLDNDVTKDIQKSEKNSLTHLLSEKNPQRSLIIVFLQLMVVMRRVFVFMLLGCQVK